MKNLLKKTSIAEVTCWAACFAMPFLFSSAMAFEPPADSGYHYVLIGYPIKPGNPILTVYFKNYKSCEVNAKFAKQTTDIYEVNLFSSVFCTEL